MREHPSGWRIEWNYGLTAESCVDKRDPFYVYHKNDEYSDGLTEQEAEWLVVNLIDMIQELRVAREKENEGNTTYSGQSRQS